MFIYNLKMDKKAITSIFIAFSLLIISSIILFSIYVIFFKNDSTCIASKNEILNLNETNYTNILKAANEDIESFVGLKVRITGYVYRLIDFDNTQFVVARDMKFGKDSQSLVVGFLCESKDASKFSDGTWVEVVGKIKKGRFNDELAVLDIISIKSTNIPANIYVNPPDNTYIPTFNIF